MSEYDEFLWDGVPLRGLCGHCGIHVDSHDPNHRVTSIVRGGRGVECVLRGDIEPRDGGPLGPVQQGADAGGGGVSFDSADLCRQKGWGPGTRLVGDEGHGSTVIEITAVGERWLLAKVISHNGEARHEFETTYSLGYREWQEVAP